MALFSRFLTRRKVRLLAIAALIGFFLLFQAVRKNGREGFTFESSPLPPYTDNPEYVKKPAPKPVPWPEPPPPPPGWTRPAADHNRHDEQLPIPQNPRPADSPTRQRPAAPPRPERPGQGGNAPSPGNKSQANEKTDNTPHRPEVGDVQPRPGSSRPGNSGSIPHQPPAPGDINSNRPLYSPEELAPRIEKYPLSPNQIIRLPKMRPGAMPKIQASSKSPESAERRRTRSQRRDAIKRAMKHSWDAYSKNAMGHDEVRPVSARPHDPFCGWGATLIDSLDTLQIMGMDYEYKEALKLIGDIDFAHTKSNNIPLFETVIRYLGGLIGAFDVSGGKDTILLDKAKQLADMLMGAFDTHNRMPILRYDWRPQASRQNTRASQDAVLAEIGTLSLEFTRLAQITGNHSYYDAVLPFRMLY
jgi:mannosyl-oligosaccharide alpha-1,2-mannosidase